MRNDNPCWSGYKMYGTKKKDGKEVPNCVKELQNQEIDELNTTSSAGGEYATPYAFSKDKTRKKGKPKKWSYVEPSLMKDINMKEHAQKINRLRIIIERIVKRELALNEISYNEFKKDDSQTFKQKINNGIHEVSKQLKEIETTVTRLSKLKTETGADQTVFFKTSSKKLHQISERLLRLENKIREISK